MGQVWLDNPWDAGRASFDFDKGRFPDPEGLISTIKNKNLRLVVWTSPFVGGDLETMAKRKGWTVTGARPDNNDATYFPARSLDTHIDFTNPEASQWFTEQARKLIRRGIDGFKTDRGEEDFSDSAKYFNGLPNAKAHNVYIEGYHKALFDAFKLERPNNDFALYARGGWNASARWSGHWAADNISVAGEAGLTQALRSLLSLSMSGFFFNGSDMGGYVGLRQDMGEASFNNPALPPTPNTYIRWVQLGALSPVMQGAIPPWWVNDQAISVYKTFATLHDKLSAYIHEASKQAVSSGIPIVQSMVFAYPNEPLVNRVEDQYLLGPDLLVAPIHGVDADLPATKRLVAIPAGQWVNAFTGVTVTGPLLLPVPVTIEQMPLFVKKGSSIEATVLNVTQVKLPL